MLMLMVTFAFSQKSTTYKQLNKGEHSPQSVATEWALLGGNFVEMDINGVEHDLQAYLDEGKTIIIDFSATWCAPCVTLHESGVLEDLHNTYGPDGTDELVVLWVDVEGSDLDVLQGNNSQNYDWTVGGTWPVPIISSTNVLHPAFSELYQGWIPTVFMACPSGYYKDITPEAWIGAAAVYALVGSCPISGDLPLAEISGPTSGFIGEALTYENTGASVDPVTGYEWTFDGGTPATSDESNPSVIWDAAGTYEVTLVVTNENGSSEAVSIFVNMIDGGTAADDAVTFEEIIVEEEFPSILDPYNWTTYDNDDGSVWPEYGDFGIYGDGNTFAVYSNSVANGHVNAFDPYEGDKCAIAVTNNPDAGTGADNDDWLISPLMTLGTGSSIEFYVLSVKDTWGLEEYNIAVSTTDNLPESFTVIGGDREAAATWEQVTQDLSEFDGQDVYIAIHYTGGDHYVLAVDNINIYTSHVGVENLSATVKIYPNPATELLHIWNSPHADIQIFDILGKIVISQKNIAEKESINISNLDEGTYFIRVNGNHKYMVQKIVISK